MPEAKLLFGIAAVVILGLVAWVVAVLRAPGETWARDVAIPPPAPADEPPLEPDASEASATRGAEPGDDAKPG